MSADLLARGLAAQARAVAGRLALSQHLPATPLPIEQLHPAPPTMTTGASTSVTGRFWAAVNGEQGTGTTVLGQNFAYAGAGELTAANVPGVYAPCVTLSAGQRRGSPRVVSFLHDGQNLAIELSTNSYGLGIATYVRVKVDGRYVSLAPYAPGNGDTVRLTLAFATRAVRRIDLVGQTFFRGVWTDATDTITPAPLRGPRCIVMADSFGGGAAETFGTADSFPTIFADAMGWDDVWPSAVPGSGYVAGYSFGQRAAADVIAYQPDLVLVAGGRNDNVDDPAAVGTAAAALFAQLRAALPTATVIAAGPLWNNGPAGWSAGLKPVRDAIRAAAWAAQVPHVDFLERPFRAGYTPAITTLASAVAAGASSFQIPYAVGGPILPVPSTVEIAGVRREVKAVSYQFYTIDGTFPAAIASGATVTQVGDGLWSGTGRTGAATGWGNADLYSAADNTHPTSAGQKAIGAELAARVWRGLMLGPAAGPSW